MWEENAFSEEYPAQSSLFCLHVSQKGRSPEQAVLRLRHVKQAAPMRRLQFIYQYDILGRMQLAVTNRLG